jgi:uroporphyrinogen decarboxylase
MNSRQRIQKLLAHEEPDHIGKTDSFWEDTLTRWQAEGYPPEADDAQYFGFDFDWLFMDASLRLPEKLIEETDEYTIRNDKHGFIGKQWKGKAGALGYLDHAVKSSDDWDKLKNRLTVSFGDTSRIHTVSYFTPFVEWPTWEQMAAKFQQLRQNQRFILLMVYGPHEANWRKHGFEQTLMEMVLDPGLMIDMSKAHTDLVIDTLKKGMEHGIKPDGILMAEDLGVNTGLMFSPQAYDKILFAEHRRLGDFLHTHGITYFIHSDGDIRKLIPRLIDAGIQVLQPLEARAGLDVRLLKAEYGIDLSFMGNISVESMVASKEKLEEEVCTKLAAAMPGGGYIYHSDHSVPSEVPFENYVYLMELLQKYGSYK